MNPIPDQIVPGHPDVPPPAPGDVEIVQDHLVQRGGGERVLLSMARALPGAPIHTSFHDPAKIYSAFGDLDIRPAGVNRIRLLRDHHRAALPMYPWLFGRMRFDAPVLVCGTSGWSAGAHTTGRKILYFHSLARWLHDRDTYLPDLGPAARLGLTALAGRLRRWDRAAVESADRLLVYSTAMKRRVEDIYGRPAQILPPPVTIDPTGPAEPPTTLEPGYFLCPCRLIGYKNVDAVLHAFEQLPDLRLVVAGHGPDEARLRSIAPPNARFLGMVDDRGMRWLYRNARGIVSAAYEPFGLTPVEANMFGVRSVVLRAGGFLDTVVENLTGTFFDQPEPHRIAAALTRFLSEAAPAPGAVEGHAQQWSESTFIDRLRSVVHEELA